MSSFAGGRRMNRLFRIDGWEPGSTDDTKVRITEVLFDGGATRSFVMDVRLEDAILIVGCLDHCRKQKNSLRNLKLDRPA